MACRLSRQREAYHLVDLVSKVDMSGLELVKPGLNASLPSDASRALLQTLDSLDIALLLSRSQGAPSIETISQCKYMRCAEPYHSFRTRICAHFPARG
jgi:hypothetical protein